jgi:hypothetical protein
MHDPSTDGTDQKVVVMAKKAGKLLYFVLVRSTVELLASSQAWVLSVAA